MSERILDPIILGHNPFFGIDHLSQHQGNEKAKQFEDVGRILDVLRFCHKLGVRGMMMSTHPRAGSVCASLEREPENFAAWRVYPLLPNIQKYIRSANEKGLVNIIAETLSQASLGQKFSIVLRGGRGLLSKDVWEALSLLLDVEMLPFRRMNLGAVFLHDALTDLALSLELDSVLAFFRDHIEKRYGARAGFVTKNLPLLRKRLDAIGWDCPLAMASFNASGFYMNPDAERCAEAVRRPGLDFVAMNTLASGFLPPEKAYRYLAQFPAIRSVVVGVSREEHAVQTVDAIKRHLFRSEGNHSAP